MKTHNGACHCGFVKFRITANIDHVRQCDCSICAQRGALNVRVSNQQFDLETPLELLSSYRWGTHTAVDYFCPTCGISAFRRPSHPSAEELESGVSRFDGWAVDARCLDELDLGPLAVVKIRGKNIQI